MPQLRHVAITTHDVAKTAKFYVDVFGMKEVGKIDDSGTTGCFLSDGVMNLAILCFENDQAAGVERGAGFKGIHHIGFEVEDMATIQEKLAAAGSTRRHDVEQAIGVVPGERKHNVEVIPWINSACLRPSRQRGNGLSRWPGWDGPEPAHPGWMVSRP